MKTETAKQKSSTSCVAMQRVIEKTVQRARNHGGAALPALRTALLSGLEARRDALAVAVHNAALAKISLDHWGVAVREAEEVVLELATAAAGLEEVLAAVTEALKKGEAAGFNAKQARRAS